MGARIHTAEPLVTEPRSFDVGIAIVKNILITRD
jgi:hypothetical protein